MPMPVLAVKSFDSSTRALAGSHAAQHRVSSLAFAAPPPSARPAPNTTPNRDRYSLLMNFLLMCTWIASGRIAIAPVLARVRAGLTSSPDRGEGTRPEDEQPRSLDGDGVKGARVVAAIGPRRL